MHYPTTRICSISMPLGLPMTIDSWYAQLEFMMQARSHSPSLREDSMASVMDKEAIIAPKEFNGSS